MADDAQCNVLGPNSVPALDIRYTDDPKVVQEAKTEDYSLHVVPRSWRSSRTSLLMAYSAVFTSMFNLIVAPTVALAVGTVNAIIAMVLAVVLYGVINYVVSAYAARTGLTVALFSRSIFGYVGAALATLLFASSCIFFAVFESSVISVVFQEYFGVFPLEIWYLLVAIYGSVLVLGGVVAWLDKINGVLLPLYIVGLVAAVIWAIVEYGNRSNFLTFQPDSPPAVAGPGWLYGFAVYMGVFILMMFTMDYARFGRREDERFHGIITFGPVFYLLTWLVNGVAGIYLALTVPREGALTEISSVLALVSLMGFFGVILVWATQTKINTANLYLASTNLQSFVARALKVALPRTVWVAIVGAIVYLLMLINIFEYLVQALAIQAVLIVSWTGIALTQIGYRRVQTNSEEQTEFRPGRVPQFNPAGLGAWFVSSGVGLYLLFGTEAFGVTWSPIITFALAILIYGSALRFARRKWFVLERPYDPKEEVDDPWEARVRCSRCDHSYLAIEMDRDPRSSYAPLCAACATVAGPDFHRQAASESEHLSATSTHTESSKDNST